MKQNLIKLYEFLGWTQMTEAWDTGRLVGMNPRGNTIAVLDRVSNHLIKEAQERLTGEQWNAYATELESIMLNEAHKHFPSIKYASLDVGKCILFLKASDEQKCQALINALDMWGD